MFDSPFEFCPVCRAYVLLDQTRRECAREHGCADEAACPLRRVFTGIDFAAVFGRTDDDAPAKPPTRTKPALRCPRGLAAPRTRRRRA